MKCQLFRVELMRLKPSSQTNRAYPEEAKNTQVEGVVRIVFVIDEQGSIQNAEIYEGLGAGCDEEALRLIREMPTWNPGKIDGKAVKTIYRLPIYFGPKS